MCLTANINRGKGKPASKPVEFHPFARRKTPPRQATPEELKALFGPNWAQVQTS